MTEYTATECMRGSPQSSMVTMHRWKASYRRNRRLTSDQSTPINDREQSRNNLQEVSGRQRVQIGTWTAAAPPEGTPATRSAKYAKLFEKLRAICLGCSVERAPVFLFRANCTPDICSWPDGQSTHSGNETVRQRFDQIGERERK